MSQMWPIYWLFYSFKCPNSVLANPETPPKIDWAAYKGKVPVAGMVDNFQKQYEALKVPYPADTVSAQVDQQKSTVQKEIESFKAASNNRISEHQKSMAHLQSLLPYDQMTMEDYRDAFPEVSLLFNFEWSMRNLFIWDLFRSLKKSWEIEQNRCCITNQTFTTFQDALDPINKPTFWPHTPEEQVGYKPKDQPVADH